MSQNRRHHARRNSAAILPLLLASCVPPPRPAEPPQPPEYSAGYTAGCSSGHSAAGDAGARFLKDPLRFQSDQLYAQGWNDGFSVCKSKSEALDRLLGPVF